MIWTKRMQASLISKLSNDATTTYMMMMIIVYFFIKPKSGFTRKLIKLASLKHWFVEKNWYLIMPSQWTVEGYRKIFPKRVLPWSQSVEFMSVQSVEKREWMLPVNHLRWSKHLEGWTVLDSSILIIYHLKC